MGVLSFLKGSPIVEVIGKVLERVVPDPQARALAALELAKLEQAGELAHLDAEVKTILAGAENVKADAQGNSSLQRNWRPLLMLAFGGLIVARFLGFAAPDVSEAEYLQLWEIVKFGLGGYVVGRSAEKIAKTVAPAIAASRK